MTDIAPDFSELDTMFRDMQTRDSLYRPTSFWSKASRDIAEELRRNGLAHFRRLPLPLDYPVRNMDDWLKVKDHYAFSEERFAPNWEAIARRHSAEGRVVTVHIPGGFDEPRQLMGEEALCIAYYEQPELIHDMLRTFGDTAFRLLDRVSSTVPVDQLSLLEDLAGKS